MKKVRITIVMLVVIMLISNSVYAKTPSVVKLNDVSLVDQGNYFAVSLDIKKCKSHWDVGKRYAEEILEEVPDYEYLIDSYLAEVTGGDEMYNVLIGRTDDMKPQINKDYRAEIEGMASKFSAKNANVRGDGKLSTKEMYMFNLFPDIARGTQCSVLAVYNKRSETNSTIAGRNLDWYAGSQNQLVKVQAVMTIKNGKKSICSIGYLGFLGIITGFNDNKVFAAILDSEIGTEYTTESKYSYPLDLRYALENKSTLNEVAYFMRYPSRGYTYGHLIFICDPKTASVVENNISEAPQVVRATRTEKSSLNQGIEWGINNAVGAVNSFLLKGNVDNHSEFVHNTERWKSLKEQLLSKGDIVTLDEVGQIMTFNKATTGIGQMADGSIYNDMAQQIVLFEPENLNLQVYFRPEAGLSTNPEFETVNVDFR